MQFTERYENGGKFASCLNKPVCFGLNHMIVSSQQPCWHNWMLSFRVARGTFQHVAWGHWRNRPSL